MPRRPPKALLLDLDDTLYDEWQYVQGGLRAVADHIAKRDRSLTPEVVLHHLRYEWALRGRTAVFDRTLAHFGLPLSDVPRLVAVYRAHRPSLVFHEGVPARLRELHRWFRLAVVTDGQIEMQRAKVDALGLEKLVDHVFYCDALDAPKPDPRGFLHAAEQLGCSPEACLVIGDDPYRDVVAARRARIPCWRVRTGRFRHIDLLDAWGSADAEFASFVEAADVLLARESDEGGQA